MTSEDLQRLGIDDAVREHCRRRRPARSFDGALDHLMGAHLIEDNGWDEYAFDWKLGIRAERCLGRKLLGELFSPATVRRLLPTWETICTVGRGRGFFYCGDLLEAPHLVLVPLCPD